MDNLHEENGFEGDMIHDEHDVNSVGLESGGENVTDSVAVESDDSVVVNSLVKDLLNAVVRIQINSVDDFLRFKGLLEDNGFQSFEADAFMSDYEIIQKTSFITKEKVYELFYGVKEFGLQADNVEEIDDRLLDLVNSLGVDLQFLYGVMTRSNAKTVIFQMDGSDFTKRELS